MSSVSESNLLISDWTSASTLDCSSAVCVRSTTVACSSATAPSRLLRRLTAGRGGDVSATAGAAAGAGESAGAVAGAGAG
eukprot:5001763-Prymnesium_polylepis.1